MINIFNSSKGPNLHSTSKNISVLLTLLLLVSCFGNRPVIYKQLPENKDEILNFPEYESKLLSLERFYKRKGYAPINLVNSEYWRQQNFQLAYLAWQRNCKSKKLPIEIFIKCKTQQKIDGNNSDMVRKFFEENFRTYAISGKSGLLTAYYEPVLRGSRKKTKKYYSPIYKLPSNLPTIGKLRNRTAANTGPNSRENIRAETGTDLYPTRRQIIENDLLKGNELVFLEDSVENFFLHIQGSGTIALENGKRIRVGYAGSNGRPYRSIARWLDTNNEMPLHKASMENIKNWVKNNPKRSDDMFNYNPRFIFFQESQVSKDPSEGPRGTLGVPLTANHSIAVDVDFIKLGTPVMVIEEMQSKSNNAQSFFMMAQDTGSAIKGPNRGDLFFGTGTYAGRRAGSTKFRGRLIIFLPK